MKKLFLTNLSLALFLTSNIAFCANEFWISPSPVTAAKPPIIFPSGSIENPYDGSTVDKFDNAMRSIPPYSLIHLEPGTFESMGDTTAGGTGWGPKTGWVVSGADMYLTTLRYPSNAVVSGALNRGHLIKVVSPYLQTNITVKDLTLDCNYQTFLDVASNLDIALKASATDGTFTLNGIALIGSDNTIERVRCINTAAITSSPTNYAEAWGIFIVPSPFPDGIGNVVEGCVVSDFHGNFHNNLSALGLMAGSGIIRMTNTTGNASATVEAFFFHPAPSRFYNISIKDNSVRVAGTNKFPNQRFIFAYNSHGILIKNNRVDASLPSYFSGCTGITMMDNYDLTGNPLPIPQIILPTPP
jgi:hypothetical protein